ncbi:hypothetical protein CR513_41230, partial [Mucuna pruriens]
MGSKGVSTISLVLTLNLLFFSMVSSNPLVPANWSPVKSSKCPENLHICAKILPPPHQGAGGCCPLIQGLVDLDAAVCLCAILKVDVGGIIHIRLDLLVNIILNLCGRKQTSITCD